MEFCRTLLNYRTSSEYFGLRVICYKKIFPKLLASRLFELNPAMMYGTSSQKLLDLAGSEIYQYRKEPFELASGNMSNHYFNCRKITLHPERLALLIQVIHDSLLPEENLYDTPAIGGMTMGADPIILGLALKYQSRGKSVFPLIVRKEAKGHGMGRQIEGEWEAVKSVLAIDDVITTGGSTIKAIKAFREAGLEVNSAICIVDREEGGTEALAAEGVKLYSVFKKRNFK